MFNKIYFLFILVFFLTACSNDRNIDDLKLKIGNKRAETVGEVESIPDFQNFEEYFYKSGNLKSPFQETIVQVDSQKIIMTEIRPDLNRVKGELEKYNLEDFVMRGIINREGEELKAILFVNRKIYTVSLNDYIGRNNGKIISIDNDRIILQEIVQNGSYRWIERPATIQMRR